MIYKTIIYSESHYISGIILLERRVCQFYQTFCTPTKNLIVKFVFIMKKDKLARNKELETRKFVIHAFILKFFVDSSRT